MGKKLYIVIPREWLKFDPWGWPVRQLERYRYPVGRPDRNDDPPDSARYAAILDGTHRCRYATTGGACLDREIAPDDDELHFRLAAQIAAPPARASYPASAPHVHCVLCKGTGEVGGLEEP